MTEREKLIELLYDIRDRCDIIDDEYIDEIADELLEHGVTNPVRCGECKHMAKRNGGVWCKVWENYNGYGIYGFCCYGERRADNDNS